MSNHIPYAAPYSPQRKSQILLDFANHINRTKPGTKGALTFDDPEYYVMEHLVSDEMAEAGMAVKFKHRQTIEQIAETLNKPVDETERLIWDLVVAGGCDFETVNGVKEYWLEVWVPGHMEMFMNHPDAMKYPEIAYAFDAYGKKKGLIAPGMIPMGMAPMRVIPIESAIDSNSRKASFEEISHYLDENTIFSVSNCSCRTVRESMGEGCGHLKEEMCIQMGHGAEIYIATGRGRQITREEAREILLKAEANGLMHEIPNLDGSGETHAICNCCGCGCLAMRNANMFQNPDFVRSNYVAKVDPEKCVACGECVENCPVNALRLGQKVASIRPLPQVDPHFDRPDNTKWGLDKWNPDYRTNRQVIMPGGTSPCKSECPAHIGIQGYIKLASEGKYREALELIKQENPFPAVCGHICPRYCENECTRNTIDESVAIDEIKKFIAEQDMKAEHRFVPRKKHDYSDKKIAVIGAGPAGLACAYYLAIDNYSVTVFEKEQALGGMLTWGIPNFRLERSVIESEIDVLRELGVEFKTGVHVGEDITLDELRSQGYKAFYVAIGAQGGRKLGLEGEDAEGVMSGVDFLRRINLTEEKILHGKTVVIGGGNVAIDVARTAIRAGSDEVTMLCLESREQMPALPEEITEAEHEGIVIENGWGPKKIFQKDGQVTGIEFKKCIRVFNDEGRFAPEYDDNATFYLEADQIITSIGQTIEWGNLLKDTPAEFLPNRALQADATTYQTAISDVFVGGDAHTGPKFAIDAIAAGKEGAISIHRFVQPGQSMLLGRLKREYKAFDKQNVDYQGFDLKPRQQVDMLDDAARKSFRDMRRSFTPDQILQEADRCLSCGRVYVDEYQCVGCGQCTVRCKFDAITLEKVADAEGVYVEKLKPLVIRNAVKTKVKRVLHSAGKSFR